MDHDDSVTSGIDKSGTGSPEQFVGRLNRQLSRIGVVVEHLPVKTRLNGGPPCFRLAGASYREWLTQASLAYETLPYRLSMPAEPNYCHDCTPEFKSEMQAAKACLFPEVTFEVVKELGEPALVGVSRSPDVAPDQYPVYDGMVNKWRP